METKRELEAKAKALIVSSPNEAVKLYHQIWETYPEQFNEWDSYYTIKAMRASSTENLTWATELAQKYKDKRTANLYGWLIFDKCVKGKDRNDLIANSSIISTLPLLSLQKNLREQHSFPCPTTVSILKLCDAYSENLFNARRINELLNTLDHNFLSDESKTIDTQERGKVELSSDQEKYFALKTKALLKLEEYDSCKENCKLGLEILKKFHYNNDLWFKMRMALCEDKLGNHAASEMLFQELLSSKEGNNKWFLYRDMAEVNFEQGDFKKAWEFAVNAGFYGNEPHFLIGLYLLQARILVKLERSNEGKILAELLAAILKEQEWNDKAEYTKLFQYYQINRQNLRTVNEIFKEVRTFWLHERYGNNLKLTGTIISIHKNGKIGRIRDQHGNIVDFNKKDLVRKMRSIESLNGAIVDFNEMGSFDGKKIAENIIVKVPTINPPTKVVVGKTLEGTVTNVVEFGIFVRLQNASDGLLHKNSLPNNLKENFKNRFIRGQRVKVKIERVTNKGIQLKLIANE